MWEIEDLSVNMKNLLIKSKNLKVFYFAMVAQRLQFKDSLVDAKDIYTKTVCKDLETKEGFAKTAAVTLTVQR